MNKVFNILGVVPAREGSKSVPSKNIKPLLGHPLIYYTIEASKESSLLSNFVVSTESEEIAQVCQSYNIQIPFLRPKELAKADVESHPVVKHALREMEKLENITYDIIVMLQPTAPLRLAQDIDQAIELLIDTGADSVVSVVEVGGAHPLRMKRIVGNDRLINYVDQGFENMKPRQQLPPVYIRNGAIYASRREVVTDLHSLVGEDCRAYIMPKDRSVNIDTSYDFLLAEQILSERA